MTVYFCCSIKIHDLSDLREMYAIINLDDENKGMLNSPLLEELNFYSRVKQNFDGDSVYIHALIKSVVAEKLYKYRNYHKVLHSQLVYVYIWRLIAKWENAVISNKF